MVDLLTPNGGEQPATPVGHALGFGLQGGIDDLPDLVCAICWFAPAARRHFPQTLQPFPGKSRPPKRHRLAIRLQSQRSNYPIRRRPMPTQFGYAALPAGELRVRSSQCLDFLYLTSSIMRSPGLHAEFEMMNPKPSSYLLDTTLAAKM